jgi:perosamine synthetase
MNSWIPWVDIPYDPKAGELVQEAIQSTWISDGPFVDQFEREFKRLINSPFGTTVSSGTTALHLAMLGLDIGPGDEVIIPGFTFVAPANMALMVGATPVYADIDPNTWLIDPESVKKKLTKRTKAVVAVHLYGNICNMDELSYIAERESLFLIEDVAESCLSRYRDRSAGTWGIAGCFSFQATKTISMGEGGFVATADEKLVEKMQLIKSHGMSGEERYRHHIIGHNFRLTNLLAAVGCAQLNQIEKIIKRRQNLYENYREQLNGISGIQLQQIQSDIEPVMWTLAIKVNPIFFPGRDFIIQKMKEARIETRPGFYPFSEMPLYDAPKLKYSLEVGKNVICLPFYPHLKNSDVDRICHTLLSLKK